MSPLEQYQHDKRSGLYESTTEPAAEPALSYPTPDLHPDSKARNEPVSVSLPDPRAKQAETIKAIYKDVQGLEKKISDMDDWLIGTAILALVALATAIAALYFALNPSVGEVSQKPLPQTQKVLVKTKVKKIYIAEKTGRWREKLCYDYGDWNACLAFKKNLPARARVGRLDL